MLTLTSAAGDVIHHARLAVRRVAVEQRQGAGTQVNAEGLQYFESFCEDNGYEFVPSAANFVLIRVGDGQDIFEELQKQGVITRPMGGYGLPEWIRLSIGTADENKRAAEALKAALN